MHIPMIVMITMLSLMPNIVFTQETPSSDTSTEQPLIEQVEQVEQPTESAITLTEETTPENNVEVETTVATEVPALEETTESITISPETATESSTVDIQTEPSFAKAMEDMPEPVKDEPVVIPEEPEKEEKPLGIDTVSLENPQGNWLFKRIWWERAEERYEKIRILVDAIWESRTTFFVKRNELDRNVLDPFYLTVGIGQGELQAILSELIEFFEQHREEQGNLTEQERTLYETVETEEEALKQLKLDVESIASLDHAIDDALGTLMNQINRVRQFERQAWENFKEIAHILNDTKARELYYMIEGAARNIKNISTYLERDFFNHFSKLVNEATKHVNRVQNQIEALKEKGVNFKRQTELLEQQQDQQEEDMDAEEEEVTPKPKLGWFGWIMSLFKNAFNAIFSIIRIPYDMIFGK